MCQPPASISDSSVQRRSPAVPLALVVRCSVESHEQRGVLRGLVEVLDGDTTVLVKGSRAAGMEDIVHLLEAGGERHAVLAD